MAKKQGLETMPKGWQVHVLELYAEGASDVEVRAAIYKLRGSFSQTLWDRWMSEEEEFHEVIKKGRELAQAWWENNGRINLYNRDFNSTLWYMNMKNRYGWADSQKVDHTTAGEKISINLVRG